jgi:hypothetical protein
MINEMYAYEFMGEQEIKLSSMRPSRILRHIQENVQNSGDYLYLVTGNIGIPTGKTWLCNGLKRCGYNAVELTEDLCEYVIYRDRKNHYYINPAKKVVTIILNEHLDKGEKT